MRTLDRQIRGVMELRNQLHDARLSRRELKKLGLLVSGSVALANPRSLAAQLAPFRLAPASPPTTPFVEAMPIPPVMQPETLTPPFNPSRHQYASTLYPPTRTYALRISRQPHRFHRDLPTSPIFGYNGTFPGPTLDATYGQPIVVRYINNMPALATFTGFGIPQEITHLHNAHTAPESDGGPWDWIDPGQYRDHHYCMARAGFSRPDLIPAQYRAATGGDLRETLTTLFFHHHRPDFTAANVYKGLVGFCRFFDELDTGDETRGWRLPSGPYDVPLVLADKQFEPDTGKLTFDPFVTDGFLGDKYTVNGKIQPFFEVKRRKYRLRVLNGSVSRFFGVVLRYNGANQPFKVITENGNLYERTRTGVNRLDLWNAERSDIIVDFSRFPVGARLHLANVIAMRDDGRGMDRGKTLSPDQTANRMLEFRVVGGAVTDNSRVPDGFRPLPPVNLNEVVRTRTWEFERRNGMWAINGQFFDPDIDHSPAFLANPPHQIRRNTAERWVLINNSGGWDHPVHIHLEEMHITRANGVPVAAASRTRRDMFLLGNNANLELFARFRDFPDPNYTARPVGEAGRYVMHCHNMVHEDHAMMVTWNIVP